MKINISTPWVRVVSLLIALLFLVFSYQNCGLVTAPSFEAGSGLGVGVPHKLADAGNCTSCHGTGMSSAAFPTNHISIGTTDCGACHTAYPARWKEESSQPFGHPAVVVGSGATGTCNLCHATDAVYDAFPAGHVPTNNQACSMCHDTTAW